MIENQMKFTASPAYHLDPGGPSNDGPVSSDASLRRRQRGLLLALAMGLAILGCQTAHMPTPPPGSMVPEESAVLNMFRSREEGLRGLQGVADLKFAGAVVQYRGKEVLAIELPNRFRVECINFMGFSDLIVCSDGERMDLYLPSERKIIRGKPIPEDLAELSGTSIPLTPVLRILMGHSPFPLKGEIASSVYLGTDQNPYLEWGGAGGICQRLWIDGRTMTIRHGEVLDGGEVRVSFQYADYRDVAGFLIPFSLDLQMRREKADLHLRYRDVSPNPPANEEVFQLVLPSLEGLKVLNLGSRGGTGDLSR